MTDQLTRQHRMTLDEAYLILNVKRGEPTEQILKHYEHLFQANAPVPPPAKPVSTRGRQAFTPQNSHYLQSKVVRARERIEAEWKHTEPGASEAPDPSPSPLSKQGPSG
jgi:import inner membrane translocase subunit TIM16